MHALDHRVGGDDGHAATGGDHRGVVAEPSRDAAPASAEGLADRLDQRVLVHGSALGAPRTGRERAQAGIATGTEGLSR
ncbi:MAG: hypothetical protein ABSH27_07720 [Solirubrobacteraceae bacterium]